MFVSREMTSRMRLDIEREQQAEAEACDRSDDADGRSGDEEHAHHGTARRTHGAQDRDVLRLVLHQHDQAGDDVERGHQHDQREDQEHHVALDFERAEEGAVALAPVGHEDRPACRLVDGGAGLVYPVGIVEIDLDELDVVLAVEVVLRLGQRHEDEGGIEFRHADLEDRLHRITLHPRRRAEGRRRAARRDEREGVAGLQRESVGKAAPDGDALPVLELVEGALPQVAGDVLDLAQIFRPDAAHEDAAAVILRGAEGLSFDERDGALDTRHRRDAGRDLRVIGERTFQRRDEDMAVDAHDLVEQLLAEAVHDREHHDQRRDPEHDAEEREAGDHRDEAFPPARAQVASGEHPLEKREGFRP